MAENTQHCSCKAVYFAVLLFFLEQLMRPLLSPLSLSHPSPWLFKSQFKMLPTDWGICPPPTRPARQWWQRSTSAFLAKSPVSIVRHMGKFASKSFHVAWFSVDTPIDNNGPICWHCVCAFCEWGLWPSSHRMRNTMRCKANRTCVHEWECPHCTKLHQRVCVQIRARASCVYEASSNYRKWVQSFIPWVQRVRR